ncbi:MAG: DNA circularization N-terminal domain-containing protein [Candidatus Pacearchaeota archaeon]|jgi:prophage DNA circulation protein
MSVFDTTYPADFKGVGFIYVSGTITAGRKTVTHEYPNKDFRYVEDLGKNLRIFSINGLVHGELYTVKKLALEQALSSKDIGILTHPFLGMINCECTSYTVSEEFANTGIANFTMNFSEAEEPLYPTADINNIAKIANLYDELYDFINSDFNSQYSVNFNRNIIRSADKLLNLSSQLNAISRNTAALNTSNTDFREILRTFDNNVYRTASNTDDDAGENISNLISNFDALSDDGATRFNASLKFIQFGLTDQFVTANTSESEENKKNNKLINGTINALAFCNLVDSATDIDYQTDNELDNIAGTLDESYDYLLNSSNDILSNDLLDKINELRNQARVFFEQRRLIVNKIIEIETKTIPMTVLAFNYYGNTDNYDELLDINLSYNPSRIEGTVKILEA